MLFQLPSAMSNRTQHYANLNHYSTKGLPAAAMERMFWQIDEAIYFEFLEVLPPVYVKGGFRIIEKLTDNLASHFLEIGGGFWCAYLDCSDPNEVQKMTNVIAKMTPQEVDA